MVESFFPASSSALIISLYICIKGKPTKYKCDAAKEHKNETDTDNKELKRQIGYNAFKY